MTDEPALQGLPVRGERGQPLGELERLIVDAETGKPDAILVRQPDGDQQTVPVEQVAVTEDGLILHSPPEEF